MFIKFILTVDDVERDRVRPGVGRRARELSGVRQVGALDQQGAHQLAAAPLGHLTYIHTW